jgi:ligand-binding sensor domain-containing protein
MLTTQKISEAIAKTFSKNFPKALLAITFSTATLYAATYGVINNADAITPDSQNLVTPQNILLARNPSVRLDGRISSTLVDEQGRLWIGTWQGLMQIDQRSGKAIASISLPNSTVTALLEDSRGYFWVGTTSGLYQIDPDSGKIENIAIQLSSALIKALLASVLIMLRLMPDCLIFQEQPRM